MGYLKLHAHPVRPYLISKPYGVGNLPERSAIELIDQTGQEVGLLWNSNAVLALLQETGCSPRSPSFFVPK